VDKGVWGGSPCTAATPLPGGCRLFQSSCAVQEAGTGFDSHFKRTGRVRCPPGLATAGITPCREAGVLQW
jgi:hypothetical protein